MRPLAKFINADPDDCVFVQNATTAVNAVLHSLLPTFKAGDVLLTPDTSYNACKARVCWLASSTR